ncbi:hypothetical protein DEO72_LG4g1472 [Vigna unguiculata]|uniref:Uncharacterized protein n=1 Tax=Vigna unguiculata TaxID=3917 RepID=A0A4D6LQZ7_VIGUN|nr:hypothetical protein DEO72_LG4g1472 [Vigna unguiculata]
MADVCTDFNVLFDDVLDSDFDVDAQGAELHVDFDVDETVACSDFASNMIADLDPNSAVAFLFNECDTAADVISSEIPEISECLFRTDCSSIEANAVDFEAPPIFVEDLAAESDFVSDLDLDMHIVADLNAEFNTKSTGAVQFAKFVMVEAVVRELKVLSLVLHVQQPLMDRELLQLQENGWQNQFNAHLETLARLVKH